MTVVLEPFQASDIEEARKISTIFNWPHTVSDWQFAASVGAGIAVRENGRLVATGLTWVLGQKIATLGLLMVAPDQQGRGIGRKVLRACLDAMRGFTIVLHATDEGVELYQSEGFVPIGRVAQCQGVVAGTSSGSAGVSAHGDSRLRFSGPADHEAITALDRTTLGIDRAVLLDPILVDSTGVVLESSGVATGYGLCRRFGQGYAIGPVIAGNRQDAHDLISRLLKDKPDQFVRVDTPEGTLSEDWLTRLGMPRVSGVVVMANGPLPQGNPSFQKYALIGHAFG